MKRTFTKAAAFALASGALMQAQVAHAQAACVDQADLSDAAIYAMPLVSRALDLTCANELSPDGFWATEGAAFTAKFAGLQESSWPGMSRMFGVFMDKTMAKEGGEANPLAGLLNPGDPESMSVFRPLIDAVLVEQIAGSIKPADCQKVERAMALVAPLPPENIGGLVSFIADMADVKDPEVCPFTGDQ